MVRFKYTLSSWHCQLTFWTLLVLNFNRQLDHYAKLLHNLMQGQLQELSWLHWTGKVRKNWHLWRVFNFSQILSSQICNAHEHWRIWDASRRDKKWEYFYAFEPQLMIVLGLAEDELDCFKVYDNSQILPWSKRHWKPSNMATSTFYLET